MKKIMLMISMIILLCACGTNKEELKEEKGITSVTCEKALDLQADQGVIIDVREKDEYEESHLEGAINIPYTEIVNKIDSINSYIFNDEKIIKYISIHPCTIMKIKQKVYIILK